MQLLEPVYNDSLIDEVLRICSTTNAVYTHKAIIARLNAALDRYWSIIADTAARGTVDDTNQTSIPVETQSLVAATNTYKISSFTNEVLQILKLSILDDNAKEFDIIREEFEDIWDFTQLYSTASADQGTPQYWTKVGDYIYLRPCPSYSETNGLRAYVSRELAKFAFTTFTVTIASPGVFSATGHGLSANDALIFETDGALPTGLTADTTVYYVISAGLTADAFEVSTTIGGSAVNTSVSQSGNHKFTKVSKEPGIPVIHHPYLARHAALPFLIEQKLPHTQSIGQQIAQDEISIMDFWQSRDKELKTVIRPRQRAFR